LFERFEWSTPYYRVENSGYRAIPPGKPMSDTHLVVLCVHGVGHGDTDPNLQPAWTGAISEGLQRWNPNCQVQCEFVKYDDLFAAQPLDPAVVAEALAKLTLSGVVNGLNDFLGLSRALGGIPEALRWTAGMVAQWADNEDLREATRERLL